MEDCIKAEPAWIHHFSLFKKSTRPQIVTSEVLPYMVSCLWWSFVFVNWFSLAMATQDEKVLQDTAGIQKFLAQCKGSLSEEKFNAIRQKHFAPWSMISRIPHSVCLDDAIFIPAWFHDLPSVLLRKAFGTGWRGWNLRHHRCWWTIGRRVHGQQTRKSPWLLAWQQLHVALE